MRGVPFRVRRIAFVMVLLGLAGWLLWIWLWPYVVGFLLHIEAIKPVVARSAVPLEGLLIRDETVVYAPANGVFRPQLADGSRVSRGGVVGRLVDAGVTYEIRSPRGGVVYYRMDGLERILVPEAASGLFEPPDLTPVVRSGAQKVSRGEALFRVADNLGPVYAQFVVPDGLLPRDMLVPGTRWQLLRGDEIHHGVLSELLPTEGRTLLRLKFESYPGDFLDQRRFDFGVVNRELSGYLVSRGTITLYRGRPGLLTLHKDGFQWVPVTIEGQIGGQVLVSGDGVTTGVRYVTNPWLVPYKERYR